MVFSASVSQCSSQWAPEGTLESQLVFPPLMPFFKSVRDARADELGDSAAPSRFPTDKSVGGDASSSIGST